MTLTGIGRSAGRGLSDVSSGRGLDSIRRLIGCGVFAGGIRRNGVLLGGLDGHSRSGLRVLLALVCYRGGGPAASGTALVPAAWFASDVRFAVGGSFTSNGSFIGSAGFTGGRIFVGISSDRFTFGLFAGR